MDMVDKLFTFKFFVRCWRFLIINASTVYIEKFSPCLCGQILSLQKVSSSVDFFFNQSTCMVSWPTFFSLAAFSLRSIVSFSFRFSSRESSKTTLAFSINYFFQLRRRLGCIWFSDAIVLRSFSPFKSSKTKSDFNLAEKFLLVRDI